MAYTDTTRLVLWRGGTMARLARDEAGNTLALATAGIMAVMGMVGGAVDMSRSYMVQSRLQQACDAGALAARKAMAGETLTNANKAVGYRYFDFNFPAGTLGAELVSRTYTQPTSLAGTPQAIVNGTVVANVPTTIMRAFGNANVPLTINCSSKMEVQSADVAMVLDITGSMGTDMRINSTGTATEDRISALHKAVRAFYTALGPGRAGGDLSKGRIRYGIVPYGVVVNVGHLLSHDQMVSSWTYQSREAVSGTLYGWELDDDENESSITYTAWSAFTTADLNETLNAASYNGWTDTSGTGNESYVGLDGVTRTLARTIAGQTSTTCNTATNNDYSGGTGIKMVSLVSATSPTNVTSPAEVAPVYPSGTRTKNYSERRDWSVRGWRYEWRSNTCRLRWANGRTSGPDTRMRQTRTGTSTHEIDWTSYTGVNYVYGTRTFDVSAIKGLLGAWNSSITLPALNRTGTSTRYEGVKLSGSLTGTDVYTGGTIASQAVTWRGCIEERATVNTIDGSTLLTAIPTGAKDLDSTLLAVPSDDTTRWRPWLWNAVFNPSNGAMPTDSDECGPPALRLQEIANYDTTILSSNYPDLFDAASGGAVSHYYPYTTSLWPGTAPAAERSKNLFTLRNYIDRIDVASGNLTDGTLHDAGFMWGLHLVSGDGMFAADNPDRFNGQVVNRNIVFMTDGEMNPGEERYVFSGYNQRDARLAPASTTNSQMIAIENRRLRIQCEAAKRQGITVWVVAITSTDTTLDEYDDLRACASSPGNFKAAATTEELVASFTTIANSIGGLRIAT
ncbi:TadE/TadG family type IV pilus assembly protein [Qipengyuania sediminis]|uniref:TadE/TadG family type IV pilus assembly protein n=1 Tax=Qipengyuania sediminis TaxID=1532023 RepID=UPI00140461CC|nr:TadE/TadG family type IV pilus assembly protein [Qipengyuania sediminis]